MFLIEKKVFAHRRTKVQARALQKAFPPLKVEVFSLTPPSPGFLAPPFLSPADCFSFCAWLIKMI